MSPIYNWLRQGYARMDTQTVIGLLVLAVTSAVLLFSPMSPREKQVWIGLISSLTFASWAIVRFIGQFHSWPDFVQSLVVVVPVAAGFVAYYQMRRINLRRLAEVLGAQWDPDAFSQTFGSEWRLNQANVETGIVTGGLRGREFEVGTYTTNYGRATQCYTYIAVKCRNPGLDFTLDGESVSFLGMRWLRRLYLWGDPIPDALRPTVRDQLYKNHAFLQSRSGKVYEEGTLSVQAKALVWRCHGNPGYAHLAAIVDFIVGVAAEVEKNPIEVAHGAVKRMEVAPSNCPKCNASTGQFLNPHYCPYCGSGQLETGTSMPMHCHACSRYLKPSANAHLGEHIAYCAQCGFKLLASAPASG